jgi:hypothetical protein
MSSYCLITAEQSLNFTVNWNNKLGAAEPCCLSGLQAAALVEELANLRKRAESSWEAVEDLSCGATYEERKPS